ncbi:MAG: DUF975 family protein [Lachnospiraceae bacterium]|nr:DUF975 family protein [Lachnospiraceae bacterium]
MWYREDLKARAKNAIGRNYWRCVLVALVLMLFVTTDYNNNSSNNSSSSSDTLLEDLYDPALYDPDNISIEIGDEGDNDASGMFSEYGWLKYPLRFGSTILYSTLPLVRGIWLLLQTAAGAIITGAVIIIALICSILVTPLLEIGGCRFFIDNAWADSQREPARCDLLLSAFHSGYYWNAVVTQFRRKLFLFLWSLLFVIPGIVKSYEYCMIPYLLADYPDLPPEEAFQISKDMMDGNKWDTFILDLSFIGWELLDSVTLGIAGVLFVNPYQYATKAELYLALKDQQRL